MGNNLGINLLFVIAGFILGFICKNKLKDKTYGVTSAFLGVAAVVVVKFIYSYGYNLVMYHEYIGFDIKEVLVLLLELFVGLEAVNLYNRRFKSDQFKDVLISFVIFELGIYVVMAICYQYWPSVWSLPVLDCGYRVVGNIINMVETASYYFSYDYGYFYGFDFGGYLIQYLVYAFINFAEVIVYIVLMFAKGSKKVDTKTTYTNTNAKTNTSSNTRSFHKKNYDDEVAAIKKYKELYDAGAISKEDFETKKKEIMK